MEKPDRQQAFDAIPVTPTNMESQPLQDGGIKVTVLVENRPLQRKLLRLPPMAKREFELDAFGKQILEWCDGKNSVSDILEKFAAEYKIHPHEAEQALLSFLRTLVTKGIVSLAIPKKNKRRNHGNRTKDR